MTYLKTFAGVIALLCAMILSNQTSAQTTQNDTARTWFNFTPCGSQFQMKSVTFNQVTNEVTISFIDRETSSKIEEWNGIKLRWFANVQTDLPERKFLMVDSIDILRNGFTQLGIHHYSWEKITALLGNCLLT